MLNNICLYIKLGPRVCDSNCKYSKIRKLITGHIRAQVSPLGLGMFFVGLSTLGMRTVVQLWLAGLYAAGARPGLTWGQVPTSVTLVTLKLRLVNPGDTFGLEFLFEEGNATSLPGDRAQQSVILVRINLGPGLCAHVLVILLSWERLPSFLPGQVGSASWLTKESAGLLFISHGR